MTGKDIDLVIRARDKASSELEKISKALKKNVSDQQDLATGAGKTSAALGKLSADAAKFERELDRLKSAGKIAVELDKATASVTRMEGSLKSNASELAKMARESDNAAQAANRLKGQLAAEENALSSNKKGLADTRKELTEVNRLVKQAEANQARYNKALGSTPDQFVRPAAKSAGAFIAADLPAQKSTQAQLTAQIREYEAAITQSVVAVKDLKPQVSAAASLQTQLANETSKSAAAFVAEKDDVEKARTALAAIKSVSADAAAGIGAVAISQDAVSTASKRAADNIARTQKAIQAYSKFDSGSNTVADPKTAASFQRQNAAVEQARQDMHSLQEETKRLAIELKNTSGNATEQVNSFNRMAAASRAAEAEFQKQVVTLNQMRGVTQSSFAAWARATVPLQQVAPATQQIGKSMASASVQTSAFGRALAGMGNENAASVSLLRSLRSEVVSLTAGYIGFQAALGQIGGAVDSYRQLEAIQSRLGSVFNQDTSKIAAEIQFLREQADRLRISFGTLADEYGKFTVAAKAANFTTADTRKIFIAVAETARVNKLSVEETSGVFLALTQMISKGKVSAEELRGQLGERLPGAFNIFAAAIGKSTAELDKMMQKGEVIADRSTLLKFADELSARFGPQLAASLDSLSADLDQFGSDVQASQTAVADGFVPELREALATFHDFSKSIEGQNTFTQIGEAIGGVIKILGDLSKYFDAITSAAKLFAAAKIAELFGAVGGKAMQAASTLRTFNAELTLIGPRTQAAANSQTVFGRSLAQTVSTLSSFRQSLLASTSQSAVARAGVVSLAAAVGGLQTTLVVAAGAFRTLLTAFGGPIGIALTAITYVIGSWLTGIDSATSALNEHKRQIDLVVAGYKNAKDKASEWAKSIPGATPAELINNRDQLKRQFTDIVGEAEEASRVLKYAFQDFAPDSSEIRQIDQLTDSLKGVREGSISVQQFAGILSDISLNPAADGFKEIADQILALVRSAEDGKPGLEDLSEAIAKAEALIRLQADTATDADKALLGMGKQAENAVTATDDLAATTKKLNDAFDEMGKLIPSLSDELRKLEQIDALDKQYKDALNLARTMSEVAGLTERYNQARTAIQDEFQRKQFDSLPDTSKSITDRIKFIEGGQSGGGPSTSSARGIGQFTESTFLPLFNRLFPALSELSDSAKLAYRTVPEFADKVLDTFTKENQLQLAKAGISPDPGNTYLAHFLGSGDAIKVLIANPNELAKNIVQPASTAANPTVIRDNTTARDLVAWANQRMGGGSPIMSGGQTKQEGFDETTQAQIKALNDEANARKESNREGFIAQQIAEREKIAAKDHVEFTKAERDALREAAGAKYDSAHADELLKANQADAKEELNNIIGLDQQRKVLIEQINDAQRSGDEGAAAELLTQLSGINQQLDDAIPKAMDLAKQLSDQRMIAELNKVQLATSRVGNNVGLLGFTFKETQKLGVDFGNGVVGAFDNFAQSIANGADAITAMKTAFLQFAADFLREIAKMILQKTIFTALDSALPGFGFSTLAGAAHTGGVVGSVATGGGNASRQVSPTWFTNAMRYHSGGIAGLAPDEVPAVLKRNEEVLTEEDPRHRFNNGAKDSSGAASQGQQIKQVLVFDQREIANAMSSSHGEKVIVTALKNNAATLRQILK